LLADLDFIRISYVIGLSDFRVFVGVAVVELAYLRKIVAGFYDVHGAGSDGDLVLEIGEVGIDFLDFIPSLVFQMFGGSCGGENGLAVFHMKMLNLESAARHEVGDWLIFVFQFLVVHEAELLSEVQPTLDASLVDCRCPGSVHPPWKVTCASVTLNRAKMGAECGHWGKAMASFVDFVVFLCVISMFVFLPYFGSYGVLVFVSLFGFTYLSRPRQRT
jgi:hypothetical protein